MLSYQKSRNGSCADAIQARLSTYWEKLAKDFDSSADRFEVS